MVDRGGGVSAQYVASQRRRKSPSAQPRSAALGSATAPGPPARPHTRRPCGAASRARSISAALQPSGLHRRASDAVRLLAVRNFGEYLFLLLHREAMVARPNTQRPCSAVSYARARSHYQDRDGLQNVSDVAGLAYCLSINTLLSTLHSCRQSAKWTSHRGVWGAALALCTAAQSTGRAPTHCHRHPAGLSPSTTPSSALAPSSEGANGCNAAGTAYQRWNTARQPRALRGLLCAGQQLFNGAPTALQGDYGHSVSQQRVLLCVQPFPTSSSLNATLPSPGAQRWPKPQLCSTQAHLNCIQASPPLIAVCSAPAQACSSF